MSPSLKRRCGLALSMMCVTAQATNQIPDPNFDVGNVSHWGQFGIGSYVDFDATRNIQGAAGSGSLLMTNFIGGSVGSNGVALCLQGTYFPGIYTYGAWLYVASGQSLRAAGVGLDFYQSGNCSGGAIVGGSGNLSPTPTSFDTWTLSTQTFNLLSIAFSARIYLYGGNAGKTLKVNFDGVRFGFPGTTPVTLQSFGVD